MFKVHVLSAAAHLSLSCFITLMCLSAALEDKRASLQGSGTRPTLTLGPLIEFDPDLNWNCWEIMIKAADCNEDRLKRHICGLHLFFSICLFISVLHDVGSQMRLSDQVLSPVNAGSLLL